MENGVPGVPGVVAFAIALATLVQESGQENVTIHPQRTEGKTVVAQPAKETPALV